MSKRKKRIMSKSDELWDLIKDNANKKGYVRGLDTLSLKEKVLLSKHDINKFLWDLKGRGLIGFSEKKAGKDGSTVLYRFRLTTQGLQQVMRERFESSHARAQEIMSEDSEEAHWDPSDGPNPECGRDDCMQVGAHEHAGASPEATAEVGATREEETNEAGEVEAAQRPTPPLVRYPILVSLLDRKRLAEQAAENLEALGADNLAIEALKLLDLPVLPWQKEVMQFFADHPTFVQFVLREEK